MENIQEGLFDEIDEEPCYKKYVEFRLLPQEKMNPGLMNGYGGILYYLLNVEREAILELR